MKRMIEQRCSRFIDVLICDAGFSHLLLVSMQIEF